jgi:DNA-directed RNA polymerase subunit RPC12/RpoP
MAVMLTLPYTTFDEIAATGLEVEIYCPRCHHEVMVDLASPQLRRKHFVDVRFRCHRMVQRWTAEPAKRCESLGTLTIKPPADKMNGPGHSILHAYIGCGNCVPAWSIAQARRDDRSAVEAIWDQESPRNRLGCPRCHHKLVTSWSGNDGIPFTDGWKRRSA